MVPVGPTTFLASSGEIGPERDDGAGTGAQDLLARSMLESNQPRHTRMRTPIAAVFTPRRIAALEPAVSHEVLRYDSPVQLTSRVALVDGLEVDGVPVPRQSEVLLLGAANRDPARFAEPERFDPWRADNAPLSFGAGIHYCLGAMLARLEAAVAFPALLARLPGLAPAEDVATVRQDRTVLRGYAELPVRLGA